MTSAPRLLVSPSGKAHFPGCPHKGEDPDYSQWGEITTPRAWEVLGGGQPVPATEGARPDRVALSRCEDCASHGPWT